MWRTYHTHSLNEETFPHSLFSCDFYTHCEEIYYALIIESMTEVKMKKKINEKVSDCK